MNAQADLNLRWEHMSKGTIFVVVVGVVFVFCCFFMLWLIYFSYIIILYVFSSHDKCPAVYRS